MTKIEKYIVSAIIAIAIVLFSIIFSYLIFQSSNAIIISAIISGCLSITIWLFYTIRLDSLEDRKNGKQRLFNHVYDENTGRID
jgi:uncharacterized MnhB-related membrane protein